MKKLFVDIENLYSLAPAAKKDGRNIQEEDLGLIQDAAILTEGGKISWIGKKADAPAADKTESLNVKTLLPAFIDCHTHMVFGGDRRDEFELRNKGASYQEIAEAGGGIVSTVKATREASEDELLELAKERESKYITQGVATVEIKSGYGLTLQDELKILKVARKLEKLRVQTTFLGPHAIPKEFSNSKDYLDEVIQWLPEFKGIADRVDMFIEQGYFSLEDADRFFAEAEKLGFGICAHTDQLNPTGSSLYMAKKGALSVDHCVRMTDQEIINMAKTQTTAVLLPASDFYIRVPYPPARRLIEAGVPVALATDFNPGSAPSQDISFTGILARIEMKMTLPEVLLGLTFNAARALGLQGQIGSLEVGKSADFICMKGPLSELFYEVGKRPIHALWKDAKSVFSN